MLRRKVFYNLESVATRISDYSAFRNHYNHHRQLHLLSAASVMDQSNNKSRQRPHRGRRFKAPRSANPNNQQEGTSSFSSSAQANGFEANGTSSTPATSGVSKPSLTIDVPTDTPSFSDLSKENLVHPTVLQTISQDLKFAHMTPVQAATIYELLSKRSDVLAQAKTGTGKTIAFLLPAIQTLLNRQTPPGRYISLLVISPTRELAMQIAKEAEALLQRLPQYSVCLSIGGTNKNTEEKRIIKGCDILIGTPGRLYDHLGNSDIIAERAQKLDTLVLDEADRLLDMGFLGDLKKIFRCLPDRAVTPRQGMLFSATIAPHVEQVAHLALSKDYKFISTISKGEINTHERVPQHLVVVPSFADVAPALIGALNQELTHIGHDSFKAIVFAPTAGLVDFYLEILSSMPGSGLPPIHALHARMTQSRRTKTTDTYRTARNGILVATDVVARGMDFPGVTNVMQVGVPADRESYVHRLGRTARAGAEGRGTFIVTEHERYFPKWTLKDIAFEQESPADLSARDRVLGVASQMEESARARVYQGWLGFYKNSIKALQWDVGRLVQEGNQFALEGLACPEVPTLQKSTVGKMGLKGVRGLKVGPDAPRARHGRRDGAAGGSGNGGGGGGGGGGRGGRR